MVVTRRFLRFLRSRRSGSLRILSALGSVALGLLLATTATAEPLYPQPDPDPFFAAPADLAAHRPGDVLDVRALPPVILFPGATVTLVSFRSTNSQGAPIAATTTILTPFGHQPDGPLLSYQHFINALGTACAVSHQLYSGDPNLVATASILNTALAQGWSVALPDHLGPNFAFGAARLGGQIVLDGVRAVKRLPELAVQHSRVVLAGYSGGGMATGWAAALQPSYAPELELAGAAIGGAPMNMEIMAEAVGMETHPAFGLAMAAAIGLEREYPQRVPVSRYLNKRGLAVRDAMANSCTNQILVTGVGGSAREYLASTPTAALPEARVVLRENSLEFYDGVPEIPVFEWHSPTDPLIPIEAIDHVDSRWCAAGVRVQTLQVPAFEHLSAAVIGAPGVLTWLNARILGEPAPASC
ncbi:lipase family protein [Nocardia pseudovaccinii]|uniref:lipase family protein n=1 Tax=Nocardia pseudovaccinii TaxID=189540 RepID=UPI0009FD86E6|nr:lipase family protein [Nocardia pseudovaccinii]